MIIILEQILNWPELQLTDLPPRKSSGARRWMATTPPSASTGEGGAAPLHVQLATHTPLIQFQRKIKFMWMRFF